MRGAGVFVVLAVTGLTASSEALGACCRNYQEFADACRAQGGIPSPNPATCSPRPSAPPASQPARSHEADPGQPGAAAAEAAAAAAADDRRRKEDAERQARFIRDRDAAVGTLRGSIGTSAGANSARGTELRGSQVDTGIREIRSERMERDLGGRQAAWKQLHCAASILGPALDALKIDGSAGVKADYSEFRYLADEALNALTGQKLGVACAPAPEMPRYSGPAIDPGRQAEVEKRLVIKTRDLAAKLEEGRRKQADAQGILRQASAPAPAAAGGVADAVERQRQINRARDNAANEMANAQRDFNEGKRSEESAKKELQKIQEKVERVVRGEPVTFDEEPPAASRGKKK